MLGHRFKLERADEHLKRLEDEVLRWLGTQPYRFIYEFNPESNEKIVRVEVIDAPPVEFGITIGDIVHNLRSALDNLVYELVVTRHGDSPPPEFVKYSEFPIFGDRPMKAWERKNKIGGIDPLAQADIEELQPYKRGNNFASDPLWVLHKLSNFDKHRLPHLTLVLRVATLHFIGDFVPVLPKDIEWTEGPLEDGAVVGRYPPPTGDPQEKVNVDFHPILSIGFGHGSPPVEGRWVLRVLGEIGEHITRKVLPPLTCYLT